MGALILDPSGVVPAPWRNGGGTTRELASAVSPDGELLWRISVADLDRGAAFSSFPGVDRIIVALGPLRLTVDGEHHRCQVGDRVRFPGEAVVSVSPAAPTRALNVMTGRGAYRAEVVVRPQGPAPGSPDVTVLLGDLAADVLLTRDRDA